MSVKDEIAAIRALPVRAPVSYAAINPDSEARPFEMRPEEACWTGPFPPMTFRPEEWRMDKPIPAWARDAKAPLTPFGLECLERAMAELDREDAIMSAVRAVARGG